MHGATFQPSPNQSFIPQPFESTKGCSESHLSSQNAMEVLYSGNGIVKMLHNVSESDCKRLDRELDELKETGEVKASSTSLLTPGVPANVYRDLGLLLSARECKVHCMYPNDAGTIQIDALERQVKWNPVEKAHCIFNLKSNEFDIPADQPIRFRITTSKRKVESLNALETMMKTKSTQAGTPAIPDEFWAPSAASYTDRS